MILKLFGNDEPNTVKTYKAMYYELLKGLWAALAMERSIYQIVSTWQVKLRRYKLASIVGGLYKTLDFLARHKFWLSRPGSGGSQKLLFKPPEQRLVDQLSMKSRLLNFR